MILFTVSQYDSLCHFCSCEVAILFIRITSFAVSLWFLNCYFILCMMKDVVGVN